MTKYEKLILKIQILNIILRKYNTHYHIDHDRDCTPVLWITTDEGSKKMTYGIEAIDKHIAALFEHQSVIAHVTNMLKERIF